MPADVIDHQAMTDWDYDAGLIECRACGEVYEPTEDWSDCPVCHPEPPIDWDLLLAVQREGQAPVTDDAVPVAIPEEPTKRVRTPSDEELWQELRQHAEQGQGESAPITFPWPEQRR